MASLDFLKQNLLFKLLGLGGMTAHHVQPCPNLRGLAVRCAPERAGRLIFVIPLRRIPAAWVFFFFFFPPTLPVKNKQTEPSPEE